MAADEYREGWVPLWAPLAIIVPTFLHYRVAVDGASLRFGYLTSLCSVRIPRSEVDVASVTTGSSSLAENLASFGGLGIRRGGGKWVYNPSSGPWVELSTTKGKTYRFSSRNAEEVARRLRA